MYVSEYKIDTRREDVEAGIPPTKNLVVFESNQIRSIYKQEFSDMNTAVFQKPSNIDFNRDDIAPDFSPMSNGFYVNTIKNLKDTPQNVFTSGQIKALLSPEKGVKPEEYNWMNIDEFLAGKQKIKKSELVDYIAAHIPEIKVYDRFDPQAPAFLKYQAERNELEKII